MIRVRIAPSPTGFVHIGTLRTGLFCYLFARHNSGVNILRVEDTDQNRLVMGATEDLISVFQKLGVEFDEGLILDTEGHLSEKGEYGPYLQSRRIDIYQRYAKELIDKGGAYYCYCSSQRLDELRAEQVAAKKAPMYDRQCRNLSPDQLQAKRLEFESQNIKPVVRFAVPETGTTEVHDLVHGTSVYQNSVLDDHILLKADGFPTYHLAVVVDDHLMQISHVIRGDDWVPSTPKHILTFKAFGWEIPQFAHLPLILNQDKTKLSKRKSDVSVTSFLNRGYLPEALINFIAFLGWNPKTEQEIFSMDELIKNFDLTKVNKSGAVFDVQKLDWMNSLYIRSLPIDELLSRIKPFWHAKLDVTQTFQDDYLKTILEIERERLKTLVEIGDKTAFYFDQPAYDAQTLIWRKSDLKTTITHLKEVVALLSSFESLFDAGQQIEEKIRVYISESGGDNGAVLWPIRAALSGLPASPSPFELIQILSHPHSQQDVLERLKIAIEKLES